MKINVKYSDVQEAYGRVKGNANHTPVMSSRTLNDRVNAQIYLKCENFQRVGAFKFRGAFNTISQLSEEDKQKGVITHSSGNHAQAVALSSKLLGIKATIVMPENSPLVKLHATRDTYGATVVQCESTQQARESTTNELIENHGYTMVHPYDNDNIIAGAGTAALELLEEYSDLDIVIAPVGGGGLLSGTAIASKGFNPSIKVYAAEPHRADDAYRSRQSGKIQTNPRFDTVADGLRTNLSERTFAIIQKNVEDIVLVEEQEIIEAMHFVWERMKIIIEPSSAVPIAAILKGAIPIEGKKVGIIISGGNIDVQSFFDIVKKTIVQ